MAASTISTRDRKKKNQQENPICSGSRNESPTANGKMETGIEPAAFRGKSGKL